MKLKFQEEVSVLSSEKDAGKIFAQFTHREVHPQLKDWDDFAQLKFTGEGWTG